MKNGIVFLGGLFALFLGLPMWFYLLYKILESVNASDLMWFIYWAYIPVTMFVSVSTKIAESMTGE